MAISTGSPSNSRRFQPGTSRMLPMARSYAEFGARGTQPVNAVPRDVVPEEGFEPSVEDPKSPALPLGYSGSPGYQRWVGLAARDRSARRHNTTRTVATAKRDLARSSGVRYSDEKCAPGGDPVGDGRVRRLPLSRHRERHWDRERPGRRDPVRA